MSLPVGGECPTWCAQGGDRHPQWPGHPPPVWRTLEHTGDASILLTSTSLRARDAGGHTFCLQDMRMHSGMLQGLCKGQCCRGLDWVPTEVRRMFTCSPLPDMSPSPSQSGSLIPHVSSWRPLHLPVSARLRFAGRAADSCSGSWQFGYRLPGEVPSTSYAFSRQQVCSGSLRGRNWRSSMSFSCYSASQTWSDGGASLDTVPSENQLVAEERDLVFHESLLWTALKERRTDDAWQALKVMRRKDLVPGGACFSRMVAQLCHQGTSLSLTRAQKVMADLQQIDRLEVLDKDALGLLAVASVKGGAGRYALGVVRFMLQRGLYPPVKVWSAVISRLGRSIDDSKTALELFEEISELTGKDHRPYGDLVLVRPDTGAYNAALNACATAGLLDKGIAIFKQIPDRKLSPDLLTFNIMIKLYARAERRGELQKVLEQMVEAGVQPDVSTLNSVVAALVGLGDIDQAERLVRVLHSAGNADGGLGERRKSLTDDLEGRSQSNVSMTDGGDRSRFIGDEHASTSGLSNSHTSSLEWLRNVKIRPDARTYTTLMKGYIQSGRLKDAIQVLVAMQNGGDPGSLPNEVTYTTAMSALIKLGMLDEARTVLQEMADQKVPANIVTYNTLLQGFCTSQQLDKALSLVDDMTGKGIQLDVVSYNTLINGCIKADDNARALEMFQKMRESGILPSAISYTTLMTAFGKNLQPKLAAKVFDEMRKDDRIKVDGIAWNAYIDAFCRAGDMNQARKAFLMMKEAGILPSVATYNMLVRGYAVKDLHQSGEVLVLWKEIKERIEAKPGGGTVALKPDEGLLNCLVDTCVRAGFFQKAIEVVACIEQHGIPANKAKYKRMFIELYSNLYTGKHASQQRRDKSKDRRRAVEAFKFWVGLPNKYYESDWSPLNKS